jgi:hypothetical protein
MKKVTLLLTIAILASTFSGSLAQEKKKKAAVSKSTNEEELVKAAVDKESKAFFQIDYKTWAECWAHTPYAYWSFADTTDVNFFEGWNAIDQGFADYFKTSKPSTAKMERKWHEVRVYGNAAYARFTQKVQDDVNRDEQAEVRVLEKINGQWKIVHVGVIAKQKGK